jgi:hypothetical protein
MNRFYNSLESGKKYEVETLKYLEFDTFEFNDTSSHDIKIIKDGIETLIEVKSEAKSGFTGNICIEYFCRGKLSGISVTQAKFYYIYVIYNDKPYRVFKIPVEDIKNMIRDKKYIRDCNGGDDMASKIFLFKIDTIKNYEINKI